MATRGAQLSSPTSALFTSDVGGRKLLKLALEERYLSLRQVGYMLKTSWRLSGEYLGKGSPQLSLWNPLQQA